MASARDLYKLLKKSMIIYPTVNPITPSSVVSLGKIQ